MTNWQTPYLELIADCVNRESHMNDWERGFIDSISRQLEDDKNLTSTQIETLDAIWEKCTRGG